MQHPLLRAPVGRQTLQKTLSHFCAMIFWWEVSTYRHRQLKCWKHFQPTASVLIKLWRNTFLPRSADVDTAGWAVMNLLDLRAAQGQGVKVNPSWTSSQTLLRPQALSKLSPNPSGTSAPTQAPRLAGLIVLYPQTRTDEAEFREEQRE